MTQLEIFNRALAEIGHDRVIDSITAPTTGVAECARCLLAWDGSRKYVLSAHEWNWLVAETILEDGAVCTDDSPRYGQYFWSRPTDNIRLLSVIGMDGQLVDYTVANGLIYSEADSVAIRYLPDSEDPEDWPQAIADAVVYELAARISLPMSASGKTMAAMKQLSAMAISHAISQDAAEMRRGGTRGDKYAKARR